jgi:hypothetical protein
MAWHVFLLATEVSVASDPSQRVRSLLAAVHGRSLNTHVSKDVQMRTYILTGTAIVGLAMCGSGLSAQDAQTNAKEIVCAECDQYYADNVQWHEFTGGNGCAAFGGGFPTCANCGGTSACHPEAQQGPCHVACSPGGGGALVFLPTVQGLVDQAASTGETSRLALAELAKEVRRNGYLRYDPQRRTIALHDCRGMRLKEWHMKDALPTAA